MSTRCPYCRMVNALNARQCDGCGYDLTGASSGGQRGSGFSNLFGGGARQSNPTPAPGTGNLSARCPYCRAVNAPNAAVCGGCGHPLNAPLQVQRYQPPFFDRLKTYVTGHWKGVGAAIIFLLVMVVIVIPTINEKAAERARKARCTYHANGMLDLTYTRVTKIYRIKYIPITTSSYEVTYTFEANGKTYTGKDNLPLEPTRREIVVNYEPEDPTNNHTELGR